MRDEVDLLLVLFSCKFPLESALIPCSLFGRFCATGATRQKTFSLKIALNRGPHYLNHYCSEIPCTTGNIRHSNIEIFTLELKVRDEVDLLLVLFSCKFPLESALIPCSLSGRFCATGATRH